MSKLQFPGGEVEMPVHAEAVPGMRAKYEAMARRDWAVRVLDAWAAVRTYTLTTATGERDYDDPRTWQCFRATDGVDDGCCLQTSTSEWRVFNGPTPDAAREAAALAVWPELPADVRQALGERP
jgi:hypothetical protein